MHAWRVVDRPKDFVRIDIDHLDLGRVRQIQAATRGIDRENIPAALTADWNLADEFISGLSRRECVRPSGCTNQNREMLHPNEYCGLRARSSSLIGLSERFQFVLRCSCRISHSLATTAQTGMMRYSFDAD